MKLKKNNDTSNIKTKNNFVAKKQNKKTEKTEKKFSIVLSPLFFIMLAVMIFFGGIFDIVVYFLALILHEFAHAEVAARLGYTLTKFKLMPYGASLTGNFEGVRTKDEMLIAVAGPAFNIIVAIPFVALWWLVPASYYVTEQFVYASLCVAIFNILPVFPLDGGRALLAFLSRNMPRNVAYKRLRICGYLFSFLFLALFVLSIVFSVNFSFALIAFFMLSSTLIPDKSSFYQRLYSMAYRSERLKKGLAVKEILVDGEITLLKLSKMLSGTCFTRFIVSDLGFNTIAVIDERQVEELMLKYSASKTINELITKNEI
jgi:stage IV sporulation protein FB